MMYLGQAIWVVSVHLMLINKKLYFKLFVEETVQCKHIEIKILRSKKPNKNMEHMN